MLDILVQIDHALTLAINQMHNATADTLMIVVSDKRTWIPLYLAVLILFNKIFGWQKSLLLVGVIVLNVLLTDQVSVLLKDGIMRLRPCHAAGLAENLHLPAGCGGRFGFVSSHAANTMGFAVLISLILKNRWMTIAMMSFAALNGYSRIYLGKHYFMDVLGGFILGSLIAWLLYRLFILSVRKLKFK